MPLRQNPYGSPIYTCSRHNCGKPCATKFVLPNGMTLPFCDFAHAGSFAKANRLRGKIHYARIRV